MVALLSFVLGASIKESGENLSEQAEFRGACSLARDERSRTGVKVRYGLLSKTAPQAVNDNCTFKSAQGEPLDYLLQTSNNSFE